MTVQDASPGLYNEDLAPAKVGPFSIFNVWTSDVHSLRGYYLAASLFLFCGGFVNFIIAIGVGSLIIFFVMNLIGHAGMRTGVPYGWFFGVAIAGAVYYVLRSAALSAGARIAKA